MNFRIFDNTAKSGLMDSTRYPILNNGINLYSPAVLNSDSIMINPFETDFLTNPNRNLNTQNSFGDYFQDLPDHSTWPYYHPGNIPFYNTFKCLTAYNTDTDSYYEYRATSTKHISPPNWVSTFWAGYETDSNPTVTGTNGCFGGFFWNMQNFSAFTTNYEKLILSVASVVSVKSDIFLPQPSAHSYNWGAASLPINHPYTAYFNVAKPISMLYVQGLVQPLKYNLNVCYKGGNFTYHNTQTNERIVYLGTYGRILDTQTFRNTCSASNIQTLVTGNSQYSKMFYGDLNNAKTSYTTRQGGILRHFRKLNNNNELDGREYFVFSTNVPLSSFTPSAVSKSNMKAVTTPFFAITIPESTYMAEDFFTTGLQWTNATAIATFNDSTTASAEGTFNLAPDGLPIDPDLRVHDIKYGFSADV